MEITTGVFDIGKTNKKFLIFDAKLNILHEENIQIHEVPDEDGMMWDDLKETAKWVENTFAKHQKSKDFDFERLNFTTFGASLVHLDKEGKAVTPLYSYLKAYPANLRNQLFEKYGGELQICKSTASPSLGMLNSGLQLYWLKHKKAELFSKIESSLHYPQYLSYLFTGVKLSEKTSIGCHTMLWDFTKDTYHTWVKNELPGEILPKPTAANNLIAAKAYRNIMVGTGLHDSSASLIPYLIGVREKFVLISTGTWNITLNPFSTEPLTEGLLKADCLNFMSFKGKHVRASRLFFGHAHDEVAKTIAEKFGKTNEEIYQIDADLPLIRQYLENPEKWSGYQINETGSLIPNFQIEKYNNLSDAYHHLLFVLCNLQKKSLELAIGNTEIERILIAGGFAKSNLFTKLLASLLPQFKLGIAEIEQATALGAAMAVKTEFQEGNTYEVDIKHVEGF